MAAATKATSEALPQSSRRLRSAYEPEVSVQLAKHRHHDSSLGIRSGHRLDLLRCGSGNYPEAMTMPRPQFSIRTLLWLTVVVAAFLIGMILGREQAKRQYEEALPGPYYSPYSRHRPNGWEPLNEY